jgi:hypothetical protein
MDDSIVGNVYTSLEEEMNKDRRLNRLVDEMKSQFRALSFLIFSSDIIP